MPEAERQPWTCPTCKVGCAAWVDHCPVCEMRALAGLVPRLPPAAPQPAPAAPQAPFFPFPLPDAVPALPAPQVIPAGPWPVVLPNAQPPWYQPPFPTTVWAGNIEVKLLT